MSLLGFLRFLTKGDRSNMDVPVNEQRKFLEELLGPIDDVHRSFLQYKCHMFFVPRWKVWFFNIAELLFYFPVLLFLALRSILVNQEDHYDAVSNLKGMEEVIPEEIIRQYGSTIKS